jgi:hypothetical protein
MSNDVQSKAINHDYQALHEQYHAIQTECFVLRKHYQTLYEHYHELLECSPLWQEHDLDIMTYRQMMHDYCQSLQEQRRVIHRFRHTLHTHLISTRSYRSSLNSYKPTGRPFVRKTILLGVGNEQDAALLKESMQQAGAYRVFVAADSSEVLCLAQNVHIDVLVLGDELTPLSIIELYNHVHCMKGLEDLPTIIVSDCFSPFHHTELAHSHVIELEKPIKGDLLARAIDQLLIVDSCSSQFIFA